MNEEKMDEPLKQADEIFCPECAKPIKKDFTICPYCRTEIKTISSVEEPQIPQDNLKENNNDNVIKPEYNWRKDLKPFFIVFGAVVLVIALFVTCSVLTAKNTSSATATTSGMSDKIKALVATQDYMESQLKSPSSAKFPFVTSDGVEITKTGTDKYVIKSYVDSQNSFGAMIRTYYTCEVTLLSDNRYRVEAFESYE